MLDTFWPIFPGGSEASVTAENNQHIFSFLIRGLNFSEQHLQLSELYIKTLSNPLLGSMSETAKKTAVQRTKTRGARFSLALFARLDSAYNKHTALPDDQAPQAYRRARARSSTLLADLLSPLEEAVADVPLFLGDVIGTNSRFFASSDFILTQVAAPALADAGALYNHCLRDNLTRWMQQGYVEDQASTAEAHRVAEIHAHYGREISSLCGLRRERDSDVVARALAGTLDIDRCHINTRVGQDSPLRYQGLIGEAAAAVRATRQDIDIARSELSDIEEVFHLRMKHCRDLQDSLSKNQTMMSAHAHQRENRKNIAQGLGTGLSVARAVNRSCSILDSFLSGGANIISAAATAGLEIALLDVEHAMARSEAELNDTLFRREQGRRVTACWSDAHTAGVGRRTAGLHVQRRLVELRAAMLALANKQHLARQALAQAEAAIQREAVTPPSLAHTYRTWMDEDWETYRRKFAWAKQTVRHAVDALQYEKQQSLAVAERLAAARTPDALSAVVDSLQVSRLPRSVEGRRPEQHKRIVSLREEGLQGNIEDTGDGDGFVAHLLSPAAAIHDNRGRYLGQGIRFVLEPRATEQCSERVWRVHAMVKGQYGLEDSAFAEALLLKNRVFNSQWCVPETQENARQYGAAARFAHAPDQEGIVAPTRLHYTHTSAHLQPRRDTNITAFSTEQYIEGSSEALAGQGLFGEYIFLFRADNLLSLKNISDIFLRFDYHFIDRSML